jgi:hypothetical protein
MNNRTILWTRYLPNGEEEVIQFPAKRIVCYTCDGTGTTVNPSIDGNGISPEEFAEDPDFEESYFRGDYDVQCRTCKGERVIATLDREATMRDPKLRQLLRLKEKQEAIDAAEEASETWLRRAESGERY